MIPIRLQIENFFTHSFSDISFEDFQSAIIIAKINGNEKFSNGAGKTAIFNAIKYVCFNKVDVSKLEKVIRYGTDRSKVCFEFKSSLDGEIYKIERSISRKTLSEVRLFKKNNNKWEDKSQQRNGDTEKEIEKIIKINYNAFCNSVLFSQQDLNGIATLTSEKRKTALKEVLQLNVYSKYEAFAKKKASDLIKKIDEEKTILRTLGNPENDISKLSEDLQLIEVKITEKNSNILNLEDFIKNESNNSNKILELINNFENEISEFANKEKSLQSKINEIKSSIKNHSEKKNKIEFDGIALIKDAKLLNNELSSIQELKFRTKEYVREEITNLSKNILDKKVSINTLLSDLKDLQIPLSVGNKCKHCRQPINLSIEDCQAAINMDVKKTKIEIENLSKELDSLNKINESLISELKLIEKSDINVINKNASLNSKNIEIEAKKSLMNEFISLLENENKSLLVLEDELYKITKNNKSDNKEKYELYKVTYSKLKNNIQSLISNKDKEIKSAIELSNNKAVLLHKIIERNKDIEKAKTCNSNVVELEAKHILHEKVIQAFGSKGIPALIIHTILDDYQAETNSWLLKLRPGLQLQFLVIKDRSDGDKEDALNINYMLNGHDLEFAQLSNAQKLLVALALKLGLASVMKNRLGVEIGMLLIDEVDQSLDEGSLGAFEEAIKELQKEFKVLVITHNNELKTKFNYGILVEQNEQFISTARVVNTW